ncbi:LuxR C-terminal-related transcriptional regulator [Paenibacillus sp. 1001270B_150601_E10]|uniref:LuxR C-terminal-related transcriptional regulator n=1 Tax=Paenibacillus sp. 1001270B_150601_E10 TaxID=2787079 RepID=UPI00189D2AFC|nr:LuxR C-terminal-related transcriptional regulator [Paenibacillus sp. 1001270B_150601_E10]
MRISFQWDEHSQYASGGSVLASKISIPPQTKHDIIRSRLMTQLDNHVQHPITLVTAPAGFGKTTLVSRWLHIRNRKAAWVSLDAGSNEFIRFWSELSYAIEKHIPEFASKMVPILRSFQSYSGEAVLSFFLQELAQITEPCVVVLDDYHEITNRAVHRSLSFVIEHLPAHIRIVLLSRVIPPLTLSRFRVSKLLSEMNAAELRFTLEEVHKLQQKSPHLSLTANDLALLQQKTEGWAAGLALAFLYIEGKSDVSSRIESFSGSNRYIFDYLMDEVLSRQSDEIQLFLLRTSILDSMCASLADAVTERDDSSSLLTTLERSLMFLTPMDDTRSWYRYHHLFSTMLRERLIQKLSPIELKDLHQRAHRWLDRNGQFMKAIHHALEAGDHAAAAEYMERNLGAIISSGDESMLLKWLAELPPNNIVAHHDLFYFLAGTMAFQGRIAETNELLRHALQWIEADDGMGAVDSDAKKVENMLRMGMFRASIAYYQGDIDTFIELIDTHMEGLKKFASIVKVVNLSEALLYRGPIGFGGRLSKMAYLSLKVSESEQRRQAVHYALQGHGFVFLADLYYEWNRLDEAESTLEQVSTIRITPQVLGLVIPSVILQSKIYQAKGEWDEAKKLIQQTIHEIEAYPSKHWLLMLEARMVQMCLAQGYVAAGEEWMKRRHLQATDTAHAAREYEKLTVVRILINQQHADQAIRLLKQLDREARSKHRLGSRIEIQLLLALSYHLSGKGLSAAKSLEEACKLAEPEGYIRIFLDEGEPILELLAASGLAYARQLLNISQTSSSGAVEEEQYRREVKSEVSLTPREHEMLRFIANGYSNDEIARSLYLSEGTVKRYIHHLYQKLEAKNRVQAITRAKELRLL